jgi:sugar phosphate isomerase/epimerase
MNLCLYTDSVPELSFEEALDLAAEVGIGSVEIATGGQSSAPHLRLEELLSSASARASFLDAISSRGLRLAALNCAAWPMHPVRYDGELRFLRDSIALASELQVRRIVTMSGCPGDAPGAAAVNWFWLPWPPETQAIREQQWQEAIEVWSDLAGFARSHGVEEIAFELHPLHLVYNVPTLQRLREAIGPQIGANLDPSHLFWQQMDPTRVVRALGDAVQHVHLKDTQLFDGEVALNGVLDPRPWEDPDRRSWVFRTVGEGNPRSIWLDFLEALRGVGYDGDLSIENEDPFLPGELGVRRAAEFMATVLPERGAVEAHGI